MITDGWGLVPSDPNNVADDAGALLVRSGLVSSSALDDARAIVTEVGGTLGEQLVARGAIEDDALTDFYRSRLLVPQVNPNTLARLPVKVIAAIPSDMAIELRAIPVALDNDNNLTVAMSDPSDRHAVDEIAFFTGTYVVRAVASQMQIAWCLAHYYGHLTPLGLRLLQPGASPEPARTAVAPHAAIPRTKGHTGRVEITRHHAIAPVSGPIDAVRPSSDPLDLPPPTTPAAPPAATPTDDDGTPDRPRARSVSGEIRVPVRRAPSIRPPIPEAHSDEDSGAVRVIDQVSGPVITMEVDEPDDAREGANMIRPDEDPTGPRKLPPRRRKAKTDPPELAARAGEVNIDTGPVRRLDDDEPRIIIAEDALEPPPSMVDTETSGELDSVVMHRDQLGAPATTIEVDDTSVGVVIHEHYTRDDSEPVLLLPSRPSSGHRAQTDVPTGQRRTHGPTAGEDDDDDVVVLDLPKPARRDKRTQVGIGIVAAVTRPQRASEAGGVPDMVVDDGPTASQGRSDRDQTRITARAVAPDPGDATDETLAAPPSPDRRDADSHVAIAPRRTAPRGHPRPASTSGDDDEGLHTAVMSAAELDEAIPARTSEVIPGHLRVAATSNDYDPLDDGWGPPGTTIPPPLLGAMPGSDDDVPNAIPLDVDSAPLIVAPPSPPEASRGTPAAQTATSLVRALEEATSRSIELINSLEHTTDRNAVISLMIAHLAESHRRAGFFSIKPGAGLTVFAIHPTPSTLPAASLQLDRPSTLQDVVDTRLPYRGPMHDDASRTFLAAVLGACPPEILLVPVAIRERVVGVLFGEHRMRHTFDDQLALAARAAAMALERILKTKRT